MVARVHTGTGTQAHTYARIYTPTRAHTDLMVSPPQVSFMSVEVLIALKFFWAGFDFYTESAAHVTTSRITMHHGS